MNEGGRFAESLTNLRVLFGFDFGDKEGDAKKRREVTGRAL